VTYPDTPISRAAQEYVAAFNSGDETRVRRFFEDRVSPETLARRPMSERLEVYRRMKGVNGTFRVDRVVEASPDRIVLLVENATHEWRRIEFEEDPKAAGKIAGFGVEDADPPADREPPVRREATDADAARAADAWLSEASARGDFSGVVLLARNGRAFFRKAWGLADRDRKIPNAVDTKFNLGSINKIFTQVAIGQLAAAGKLSLSDTIRKHLPSYPAPYADRVTIGQLVSMSSGMGDIFGPRFAAMPKTKLRSLADYLPLFQDDPLRFEPGTRKEYSNAGYVVLGLIIEAASGEDYYRYVREHVFAPAGMKDTDSWAIDEDVPNRAIGYAREAEGLRPNTESHPARGSSAGGGWSTADDLLKFDAALRSGRLLPPEWTAWVFDRTDAPTPGAPLPARGGLAIAGGSPGVNAALDMELDGGATVIVLANLDPPVAERTLRKVRGMMPKP
jgi:CubicO group peptidase (beta-lactamase class C family)